MARDTLSDELTVIKIIVYLPAVDYLMKERFYRYFDWEKYIKNQYAEKI